MERLTISGTKEAKSSATIREVLDKLATYEDTGLMPKEVAELNDFTQTQTGKLLYELNKFQGQVVLCRDCKYLSCEKTTGIYWCRLSSGLDVMDLRPEDGCSRGKRKEVTGDETSRAPAGRDDCSISEISRDSETGV